MDLLAENDEKEHTVERSLRTDKIHLGKERLARTWRNVRFILLSFIAFGLNERINVDTFRTFGDESFALRVIVSVYTRCSL